MTPPIATVPQPGLGRLYSPDPRDRLFPMRAVMKRPARHFKRRRWTVGPLLNQGNTGTCFPAGTLVRMATGGHKPIEEVRLLEEVVTAEGNTGRVLQRMVRFHGPGLVRLKLWGHRHLRMTAEHPVLTKRGYVEASALLPGDYVALTRYLPETQAQIRPDNWIDEREIRRRTVNGRIAHYGAGGVQVLTNVTPLPGTIALTEGFGRLLGLFLAEGSASAGKTIWTFAAHEESTLVREAIALLSGELGIEARVQRRPNNTINVVAGGVHWSLLFSRLCGTGTANKGLNAQLASGPRPFLRAMLEGWLAGDGYARRSSRQGVTVSHQLVMDMYAIAQGLGYRPTVARQDPKPSHTVRQRRPRWDLTMQDGDQDNYRSEQDERATWRRVVGLGFEDFVGPVFNLHVEGDNSYVAEGVGVHNCVGHGWRNWMNCTPVKDHPNEGPSPFDIYDHAILLDTFPENDHDPSRQFGTSVRAGADYLRQLGLIRSYVWGDYADTVADYVLTTSPCVLGTTWYSGMDTPDAEGIVRATGYGRGGHCYLMHGVDLTRGLAECFNSWGPWGYKNSGHFFLPLEDLDKLIHENGEACDALEKRLVLAQPATPAAA